MKKGTKTALIIAVIAAVIAAACVYGYHRGKAEPEPENPSVQPETPDKPNEPDTPENPVQPEDPNPEGGEAVVVYVPDEQGETLTEVGANAADDSDAALIAALVGAGSLPEGVGVQSSSLENGVLSLDMNAAFGEAVRDSGSTEESLVIYALVNTFAAARGAESVLLTVDGAPLETGHDIYDYPLSPTDAP